jgi:hypothetical protein
MKRLVLFCSCLIAACTSSSTPAGPTGGPVAGAQDTHCGTKVQATSAAACHPDAGAPDAGPAEGDGGATSEYGDTMFNSEADDDDCKYHVKWSADAIRQSADVTFTVTVTKKAESAPLAGAPVRAEVFLDDTHPAPNTKQASKETASGTYTVGPIRFDKTGRWTVRFHFSEECEDLLETSPHGHAAFFVDVP